MSELPFVSVVVPCRNEVAFIGPCLLSIVGNGYSPDRLEVLVVDGRSEDGTRLVVEELSRQFPLIRLLDNPRGITPAALNIGVRSATGDVIMRMDAHATYEPGYIEGCVREMERHGADNVGGIWKIEPRADTCVGRAIARALSHPFGVGGARYRFPGQRESRWVDTVPYFCCRREVFERIGLFNEALARGQDMEFSLRLRAAGMRTLLVPSVASRYYARSDLRSFCRHNWANGVWAIRPMAHSAVMPVSWRHLVPLAFVAGLAGSAAAGLISRRLRWLFPAVASAYGAASIVASADVAVRQRDPRALVTMPVVFGILHVSYGLGSLWEFLRLVASGVPSRKLFRWR